MIGIIGASGKIGQEISVALQKLDANINLKLGSRNQIEKVNWQFVDVTSNESILEFTKDCKLIINASGKFIDQLLPIPIVDLGDDEAYQSPVIKTKFKNSSLIYACGCVPGVIALIPQKIALDFDEITSMKVNYMINDTLSYTAALDMCINFQIDKSNVKQKNIFTKPTKIPFIGESVYSYPFSDEESRAIDKKINVQSSEWDMVRDQNDLEQLLNQSFNSKEELALEMVKKSKIVQANQSSYIKFVYEFKGIKNGQEYIKTVFVRTNNPSILSAKLCACTAFYLYHHTITPSFGRVGLCDEWNDLYELLQTLQPFEIMEEHQMTLSEMAVDEEGEI